MLVLKTEMSYFTGQGHGLISRGPHLECLAAETPQAIVLIKAFC